MCTLINVLSDTHIIGKSEWNLCFLLPIARYCLRAKRIFAELHEQPYVVELDLRGIYLLSMFH